MTSTDKLGRTPLYAILSHADRPSSPAIVKLLLGERLESAKMRDAEGRLAISCLVVEEDGISQRQEDDRSISVLSRFDQYMQRVDGHGQDVFKFLDTFPDWFKNHAVLLNDNVQDLLNEQGNLTPFHVCTGLAQMLQIVTRGAGVCGNDCDAMVFYTFSESPLRVYTMSVGEIVETDFEHSLFATVLYVLYLYIEVILLANIIADIIGSYIHNTERYALHFWLNRLKFILESGTMSSAGPFYLPWKYDYNGRDLYSLFEEKT